MPTATLIGKPSSIRRCLQQRSGQVVFEFDPRVGVARSAAELLKEDLALAPQRRIGRPEVDRLQEVERARLRASEVVPPVFPREAVHPGVEFLGLHAARAAGASHVLLRPEGNAEARQMLAPCRGRRGLDVDRPQRQAPTRVVAEATVDEERLLRPAPGRGQEGLVVAERKDLRLPDERGRQQAAGCSDEKLSTIEHGLWLSSSSCAHRESRPTVAQCPAKERGPHQLRHRCRSRLVGGARHVGLALDAGRTLARRAGRAQGRAGAMA